MLGYWIAVPGRIGSALLDGRDSKGASGEHRGLRRPEPWVAALGTVPMVWWGWLIVAVAVVLVLTASAVQLQRRRRRGRVIGVGERARLRRGRGAP